MIHRGELGWLAAPLAAGLVLRLWGIQDQVLGGDELHTVRAVLSLSLPELLVTYRLTDHCLPLSAFYRLLIDAGVALDELQLRLPVLASGLLLIPLVPWMLRRELNRPTRRLLAWLIALSPLLVLYSRIVRSYAPAALLALAAVMTFYGWMARPGWRRGAAYALLAAAAVYFHLVTAPLVLAPFAFAGVEGLLTVRRDRRPLQRLAILGATTALAFASFLAPGWSSLGPLIAAKQHQSPLPGLGTLAAVGRLHAGSSWAGATALFYLAAGLGLVALLRRRRRFALFTLTLVTGQLAGLAYLRPLAFDLPLPLARYTLVALPLVLIWVAAGLDVLWQRPRGGRARPALAALLLAALVAAGPFARAFYWRSSFVHHKDFLGFYAPLSTAADIPEFYNRLRQHPAGGAIVVYPWHTTWQLARTPYIYQRLHRRRVLVAPFDHRLEDLRLDFKNLVSPTPKALLASDARYLVVHLDFGAEEERVSGEWRSQPGMWSNRLEQWRRLKPLAEAKARELEQIWGPPTESGGGLQLWDLEAVRATESTQRPAKVPIAQRHSRSSTGL